MDSSASRWFVRVEIDEQWEFTQARLLDFPVEAVVEGGAEARVYFTTHADAAVFASEVAPGEEVEQEDGEEPVVFGGDGHPTTELCLELMRGVALSGGRVADVGSGTGVLGVAARRLGARSVAAVDIDAPAARMSRDAIGSAVQGGPDCLRAGAFDVVLVNLHMAALRAVWPELHRIGAPVVLVSGILAGEQGKEAETLARGSGYVCTARRERQGWMGFVFARPATSSSASGAPRTD